MIYIPTGICRLFDFFVIKLVTGQSVVLLINSIYEDITKLVLNELGPATVQFFAVYFYEICVMGIENFECQKNRYLIISTPLNFLFHDSENASI